MSTINIPIHGYPFTTSAYEPMVRLNESGYILVIIDIFSKWIELYKCTHADAKETAMLYSNTSVGSVLLPRSCLTGVPTSSTK